MRRVLFALLVTLPLALLGQEPKYKDPKLSPEERATDLVARMTLEEKASQMGNTALAIPRLGIPEYEWWNEALHGVARAGLATVFPQAIGMAAAWDTDLLGRISEAISTEARAKYNDDIKHNIRGRYHGLTFWSPNINIFRDPRWGRGQETYGEDPYLTSRLGVVFVKGLQGNDPKYFKVVATPKHYAVHSGPEPERHRFNVNVDPRDLEDTYTPAFRATIVEGKAYSIMCAYNAVDGAPACASTPLMQDRLRGTYGFKGFVVSDCAAVADIFTGHKYKSSMPAAAAIAVKTGTDLSCGPEYKTLPEAVKQGLITEAEIDTSVKRLFVARFRLGMFDPPEMVPYAKIPLTENASAAHHKLSLEAARKSIVLLKNSNNALPLAASAKRIAVIGPAGDDFDTLLGNYNGTPAFIVTPRAGIDQQFKGRAQVRFSQGSNFAQGASALAPKDIFPNGLKAEYFDNDSLSGQPVISRTEERIYMHYEMQEPAIVSKLRREEFSIRWTGALKAPYSGEYTFGTTRLRCDGCRNPDTAQVFIDEKLVADDQPAYARNREMVREGKITLEAGKTYKIRVEYKQKTGGSGTALMWQAPGDGMLQEAIATVKDSDVTVAVVGLNARLEGEEMRVNVPGFQGGDRTEIQLPEAQEKLVRAAIDTGKPVIVVLMTGSALAVNYAQEKAAAVLNAWYGGEAAGTAIAETLAGVNNPAGRLPVTFYKSVDQLPPFAEYSMKNRTYRYFTGDPLYPFGYGLSYSTFSYSNLGVKQAGGKVVVSARVTNSSKRAGDEVAQLYVSRPDVKDAAIRQLQGFERIHLAPGQSRNVEFSFEGKGKLGVAVGGGQPVAKWTGKSYVETTFEAK
jgi:beta-glucosidase